MDYTHLKEKGSLLQCVLYLIACSIGHKMLLRTAQISECSNIPKIRPMRQQTQVVRESYRLWTNWGCKHISNNTGECNITTNRNISWSQNSNWKSSWSSPLKALFSSMLWIWDVPFQLPHEGHSDPGQDQRAFASTSYETTLLRRNEAYGGEVKKRA